MRLMQRSHDGQFVGQPGQAWQDFAEVDAGKSGGNRLQFARILCRRVRLRIKRLELAGAAVLPEKDQGCIVAP
jgi:hypothetical protein